MNKLIIKDIVSIVFVSIIMALIYNVVRDNGLPFIRKTDKDLQVSDSLLFLNAEKLKTQDELDTIRISTEAQDTINNIDTNKKENDLNSIDSQKVISKAQELAENKDIHKEFNVVSYKQMKKILNSDMDFVIIDARREDDFAEGHIGNAVNICPLDDEEVIVSKIFSLPENKTYIVYCDGGNCELSHDIAGIMYNLGIRNIFIYTGGWNEWSKKNNS